MVICNQLRGTGFLEHRREHDMSKGLNAQQVLDNVNARIAELEDDSTYVKDFPIRYVCNELSIFDWWKSYLSLSQLKAMRTFLRQAIKMGFDGYVCFKVGAKYCASGMWAYKEESEDGFSPAGDFLYRSFYSTDNYWDAQIDGEFVTKSTNSRWNDFRTVAQLKRAMVA